MKKNILVIDDIQECLLTISILLNNYYDVIKADQGKVGLELAVKKLPALILLDIALEDSDGFEICKLLKQNEMTNDIPIIFITGSENKELIIKAFECGASDYIVKPFVFEELYPRVKKHIEFAEYKNVIEQKMSVNNKLLSETNNALNEKKIALKEVLSIIEEEKQNCLKKIIDEINISVLQPMKNLSKEKLSNSNLNYLINNLEMIITDNTNCRNVLFKNLSKREIEICKLIKKGLTNKEISSHISVSIKSLEVYRSHIRKKLHLKNSINLYKYLNISWND